MIDLIVAGLVSGSIYALMAVGLIVVYRASRVLNFAHGAFVGFAAFLGLSLYVTHHFSIIATLAIVIVSTMVLALVIETVLAHPLRNAPPLEVMAVTLGVGLILSGTFLKVFGTEIQLFPPYVKGNAFNLGSTSVTKQNMTTIVATLVVLAAVAGLFHLTRIGVTMRAASEDGRLATLMGINPKTVSLTSWAIAGALAAIAAILVAPDMSLTSDGFTILMVQSFAALVLGGFTSIIGAVVGGYILGVGLNLFSFYVSSSLPATFILGVVLVILLIRPQGLFGHRESLRL